MKLDDLIDTLFKDVVRPPAIDANSPGEMVRSQLAGQMPGMAAPRPPMSMSGAPVAPVQRSAMPPVTAPAAPMAAPMNVGAAPVASPAPTGPSGFEDFMQGAAGNDLLSGLIGGFANQSIAPQRRARDAALKAQADAQTAQRQNLTMRALKSRNPQMSDEEAMYVATSGDQDLLRKYLAPQEAAKPEYREVGGRLVQIGPNGVKEVYAAPAGTDQKALTDGAPPGQMWIDPTDRAKGLRDIPGAASKTVDPKEYQTKDAMFAERLMRTNAAVDKVMGFDPQSGAYKGYDPTAKSNNWAPDTGIVASMVNSDEWKQYLQAAREGIAAILRKDTGAAVTDAEWDLYWPMLYPQPGDDAQTVQQKRQAREATMQALKGSSGPAFDKMFPNGPIGSQPQAPAPAAGPQPGTVEDGHRFKGGNPADPNNWEKVQ